MSRLRCLALCADQRAVWFDERCVSSRFKTSLGSECASIGIKCTSAKEGDSFAPHNGLVTLGYAVLCYLMNKAELRAIEVADRENDRAVLKANTICDVRGH
jgi:hypothetical protein